jgi:hypothetical protein
MNYDDMNYDGQTARHGVPSHDDGAAGAADAAQDMRLQKVR